METLNLLKKFDVLKYCEPADKEEEVSENYRDKTCECIELMHNFEK